MDIKALLIGMIVVFLSGCGGNSSVHRVLNISRDACIPVTVSEDYVDQMRFLAFKSSTRQQEKLKRLGSIMVLQKKERKMLEAYRIDYGFGECRDHER